MLVVSDTTPLLYLARVRQLEARPDAPGVGAVRAAAWLRVVPDVAAPVDVAEVLADIDAGEAAAIAVALVRHADLLLIDDAAGRRAAGELGVAVRGTLGVLVTAKAAGILVAVAPVIAALLAEGFRASGVVVEQALRASGESPPSVGST